MSYTESELLSDIYILEKALASGAKEVDYGTHRMTYQSSTQMINALALLNQKLSRLQGSTDNFQVIQVRSEKGVEE